METNFIKPKSVVKEELVRERQVDYSKLKKHKVPTGKVLKYEEFINEKLKNDLKRVHIQIDTICQTLAEYLQVKATVKAIKPHTKNVKVKTDLGCNFYAQCVIPDASKIFLNIGLDYFVHVDLDEAERIIEIKEKQLNERLKQYQEEAAKIKAYIKIVLEALGEMLI